MKMAPHPALAADKVCHVGDAVAVVIAATQAQARDAAERDQGRLRVCYSLVVDPAKRRIRRPAQIHPDVAPNNLDLRLGDRL